MFWVVWERLQPRNQVSIGFLGVSWARHGIVCFIVEHIDRITRVGRWEIRPFLIRTLAAAPVFPSPITVPWTIGPTSTMIWKPKRLIQPICIKIVDRIVADIPIKVQPAQFSYRIPG